MDFCPSLLTRGDRWTIKTVKTPRPGDGLCFLGCKEMLPVYYVEHGHTKREAYYADILWQLQEKIKNIPCGKLRRGMVFHQYNTPAHNSTVVIAAIHECGFELIQHLPFTWFGIFRLPQDKEGAQCSSVLIVMITSPLLWIFFLHSKWTKCVNFEVDCWKKSEVF